MLQAPDYAANNINLLQQYVQLDPMMTTGEQSQLYYDQLATMAPAFSVLTTVLSAISGTDTLIDPNVLRSYVVKQYGRNEPVMASLFNVGQRLQVRAERHGAVGCQLADMHVPKWLRPMPWGPS